jgi:hypothetical protein
MPFALILAELRSDSLCFRQTLIFRPLFRFFEDFFKFLHVNLHALFQFWGDLKDFPSPVYAYGKYLNDFPRLIYAYGEYLNDFSFPIYLYGKCLNDFPSPEYDYDGEYLNDFPSPIYAYGEYFNDFPSPIYAYLYMLIPYSTVEKKR